jgi:thiol:disulfide interchange protein
MELIILFGISFVGGLMINFLPCILPVLPIKLLTLKNLILTEDKRLWPYGVCSVLGSVFTFLFLALVISVIEYFGGFLMWGFHMRNLWVVGSLIIILCFFCVSNLGFFSNTWTGIQSIFTRKQGKLSYISTFIDGMITVFVGAPCVGPVLASAISTSFILHLIPRLICFMLMGLGVGLPFLLITVFPSFLKKMIWIKKYMNIVKHVISVFIFILIIWLSFIFINILSL